jgi:hypothetical protein
MASAGTVTLNLDANSVKLMRELQKAQRQTRASSGAMAADFQKAFSRIAKASAVAVTAVAGAMTAIYRSQKDVIDELAKSSDAMGIQIERLQALRYAGDLAGVGAEGLTTNLQRMQRRLGEIARNGGPAGKALSDIGLDIQSLINLSPDKQLEAISVAMGKVENAAIRASIANDLFGRDGARMLAVMRDLSANGLDPVVASLERMGVSLSRVDAARLERANDAMTTARQVFTGVFQRLSVNISDFVYYFAQAFTDAATNSDKLGEHIDAMFHRIIMGSIDLYEAIGSALSPVLSVMKSLWDSFMQLPQFARELGIVGALLFGRAGLAGVIAITAATKALQSVVGTAANMLQENKGFVGSQLDYINQIINGDAEFSPMGEIAGLFSPDYENNVSRQASFLRQTYTRIVDDRNKFIAEYRQDPMWNDPSINDLLDGPLESVEEFESAVTYSMGVVSREFSLFEKLAISAAQNVQSSFANFLFNPFENGVRGMAQGFIDTLRRMVAEAMSAKIIGMVIGAFANAASPMLSSIGTALGGSAFVGPMPSRDSGGRGSAGKPYLIGKGAQPEMFIPDSAGTFIPNADKMGGTSFSISIDATDPGAEARIRSMIQDEMVPQIIEAAKGNTIASLRRPRFA